MKAAKKSTLKQSAMMLDHGPAYQPLLEVDLEIQRRKSRQK